MSFHLLLYWVDFVGLFLIAVINFFRNISRLIDNIDINILKEVYLKRNNIFLRRALKNSIIQLTKLEGFEKKLNDESNHINDLDLNEDTKQTTSK